MTFGEAVNTACHIFQFVPHTCKPACPCHSLGTSLMTLITFRLLFPMDNVYFLIYLNFLWDSTRPSLKFIHSSNIHSSPLYSDENPHLLSNIHSSLTMHQTLC